MEDKSVLAGFAKFDGNSVLVIGQEKGDNLENRIERNFGMMRPEGYRKTIRLMELADRFNIPIISFIDTPGAYPGVGAEERGGQAEAIAKSIECCMKLKVPTLAIIIGEEDQGELLLSHLQVNNYVRKCNLFSNLSRGVCNNFMEGSKKMLDAAKAMKLSAKDLLELNVIDEMIAEPIGGAHRDKDLILKNIRESISKT